MFPQQNLSKRKPSVLMLFSVTFSLGSGVMALLLAVIGLLGRSGSADRITAIPNLITGIASITGAVGYLTFKKWAVPIYMVAVIGHIVSHTQLVMAHGGPGHITSRGWVTILLVPCIALLVLIDMVWEQRKNQFKY